MKVKWCVYVKHWLKTIFPVVLTRLLRKFPKTHGRICPPPPPSPMLLAKLRPIRSEGKFMLATLYKAKSNTGTIRGFILMAVKLTTFILKICR
jgi:hypothetical protein